LAVWMTWTEFELAVMGGLGLCLIACVLAYAILHKRG